MKKILVSAWLMLIVSAVGSLFWYNEWVFHLPTPVPANYKTVAPGTLLRLNNSLTADHSKPLFLHFFNPDCACSRFNVATFKSIVKQYGNKVNFVIVVLNNNKITAESVRQKFDMNIPVLFDAEIAKECGVYSTPQAVLIDDNFRLFYRGNYNSSRYCTDEKTSYAKIAINALLNKHVRLAFDRFALKAYGCRLPNCSN